MIINVTPDKEKARSFLGLIENRERFASSIDLNRFSTIATENYYEIIKELATIVLLLDGLKSVGENSHKELIDCLSRYEELSEEDRGLIDDLRIKRNRSSYEGKMIDKSYLENKKGKLLEIIKKLKRLANSKL